MEKQPLLDVQIAVSSDSFWNWLADEAAVNLHDMELYGFREQGNEMILMVKRNELTSLLESANAS